MLGHVSAYSDIVAKRQQRGLFLEAVRTCGVDKPRVFIVDHWLPYYENQPNGLGSFLADDLTVLLFEPRPKGSPC